MAKLTKKTRVDREKKRLQEIFKDLEPNKLETCQSLIDRAAFITVSLQDLEVQLNETGWVEHYQNGANQGGMKKAAAADVHISLTKNLNAITKQLLELVPPGAEREPPGGADEQMTPYANFIQEYYHKMTTGEVAVGKWVRILYEKITAGLRDGLFYFDERKANRAIAFIETFCHHCEGRNDLIHLELWQKSTVCLMFGIVDGDGLRIFREVFMVMGRKNGKSLFASACIAYMAYLDGEYGAKIYCLAPKLEQAAIVYDNFFRMVLQEPELAQLAQKRRSDVYLETTNTSIRPLAFNAKKSDGFNPHLAVCDEIASWPAEQGLKQYEVMKSALGARKQP